VKQVKIFLKGCTMFNSFFYGWFNVGSLLLGLISWLFPIISIISYRRGNQKNWITLSILSMSACIISLWFQIIYNNYLVKIEDWSALMDTTGALVFVSAVLIIITIILNIINLFLYKNRLSK
jgi:cytochrome c oxidase subunit 4